MKSLTLSFNGGDPNIWINPAHIIYIQVKDEQIVFTMSNGEHISIGPVPGQDINEIFNRLSNEIIL